MKKALFLCAILTLCVLPLNASSQVSVPSVDLECDSVNYDGNIIDYPIIIVNSSESDGNNNITMTCTVSNPNTYSETIELTATTTHPIDFVISEDSISLGPNAAYDVNITFTWERMLNDSIYEIMLEATVVEANGVPPPNSARKSVNGEIWVVNDNVTLVNTELECYANRHSINLDRNISQTTFTCHFFNLNYFGIVVQIDFESDFLHAAANNMTIILGPNSLHKFTLQVNADNNTPRGLVNFYLNSTLIECIGFNCTGIYTSSYIDFVYIVIDINPYPSIGQDVLMKLRWTSRDNVTHNGSIHIRLYDNHTPMHAESFRANVEKGRYNGIPFHRIVDGFMIQGGDFVNQQGTGGYAGAYFGYCSPSMSKTDDCADDETKWVVPAEFGQTHDPGVIGAARSQSENSYGSQFYLVDSTGAYSLDGRYTAFGIAYDGEIDGESTSGVAVIDQISQVECQGHDGPCSDSAGAKSVYPAIVVEASLIVLDSDGDGVSDDVDSFPNDENETHDDDGDGIGNNSDAFPQDPDETHDDDGDGIGNNSDAFPQDPDETHDDDGDGVGNNSDAFPQDPDEQYDKDGDGVGDNEDDFPDNKYASNWATVYISIITLILLLVVAGVMVSRMRRTDELPIVSQSSSLFDIDREIERLQKEKAEIIGNEDPSEMLFDEVK